MSTYLFVAKEFQTIIDFIRFAMSQAQANDVFFGHGTDNAWDDMFTLITETLNLPHDVDPLLLQGRLTEEEKILLCERLEKRILHKIPVPYLINKAYFCDLIFFVDSRVLIPRSPIAELIKQHFSPWISEDKVHRVLDLCTGSGCIAIACCYAFPDAEVDAVDISTDVLEVAEINRDYYGLQNMLNLIQSDCFAQIPPNRYDIIVSNPPYVSKEEMKALPAEYHHEPKLALEAKENGLAIVEKILQQAKDYLNPHGILVVEVGNSETALIDAYPHVPFTWLEFEHGGHGVFLLTGDLLNQYF
jgi:ribosomal protein L3 glutamine methyltransferase